MGNKFGERKFLKFNPNHIHNHHHPFIPMPAPSITEPLAAIQANKKCIEKEEAKSKAAAEAEE
jgi:hypothetical protein